MDMFCGDGELIVIMIDEGQVMFKSEMMVQFGFLNKVWDGVVMLILDCVDFDYVLVMNFCVMISIMIQKQVFQVYLVKYGDIVKGLGYWVWYFFGWFELMKGFCLVNMDEYVWEFLLLFQVWMQELFEKYDVVSELGEVKCEVVEFFDDVKVCWFELLQQMEWMF